jgi:hypothetical protein
LKYLHFIEPDAGAKLPITRQLGIAGSEASPQHLPRDRQTLPLRQCEDAWTSTPGGDGWAGPPGSVPVTMG